MAVQIPFPLPSTGYALNSKVRVNLDFIISKFNEFNTGTATWDTVAVGTANSLTGTVTFYNSSNAYYLTFQPGTTGANLTFTLPTAYPTANGKFLKSTTAGVMGFSNVTDISSFVGNQLLYLNGSTGAFTELDPGSGNKFLFNSSPPTWGTLAGTSNQVIVTPSAGPTLTLSTPQDIGTTSTVHFGKVVVKDGTPGSPPLVVTAGVSAENNGLYSVGNDLEFVAAGVVQGIVDSAGGLAMTGEVRGATSRVTSNAKFSNNGSGGTGIVTLQASATTFTDYTLTLPLNDGNLNDVLTTDGSGVLSWVSVSGAGGANTALSNLASVAINTTLVSDTDNTDDLGTSSVAWKDVFLKGALKSGGITLATVTELGYLTGVSSAIQTQINAKAADASVVHLAGSEIIAGAKTFSSQIEASDNIRLAAGKVIRLQGGTSGTLDLVAPSVVTSYTLTFPINDGGSNQVLTTDGAGVLSWSDAGTLSGTVNSGIGSHLAYYPADGTTVDDVSSMTVAANGGLSISGTSVGGSVLSFVGNADNTNASSGSALMAQVGGTSAGDPKLWLSVPGITDWTIGLDNSDSDKLKISSSGTVGSDTVITVTTNGRVGIGTESPDRELHVLSSTNPFIVQSTYAGDVTLSGRIGFAGMTATWIPAGASANGDYVAGVNYGFKNSAGTVDEFAEMAGLLTNRTVGSEEAHLTFAGRGNGATIPNQMIFRMFPISNTGSACRVGPPQEITNITPSGGGFFYSTAEATAGIATAQPGASWTARSTDASILEITAASGFKFYVDASLTSGNTFTPTLRAQIDTAGQLSVFATSNQLILGTTRTGTLNIPTPATSSRVYTFPDLSGNYDVVGTIGTQTISGTKTFDGQLIGKGTATNDAAAAGYIGEYIEALVSTPTNFPGANGNWADGTSITLSAGDWDVSAQVASFGNSATFTRLQMGISTTSGNSTTGMNQGINWSEISLPVTGATLGYGAVPVYRLSLSGSTTVYLKLFAAYTAGNPQFQGIICARRRR